MSGKQMKAVTIRTRPRDFRSIGYKEFMGPIEKVSVMAPLSFMPEKTAFLFIIKWKDKPDLTWMEKSSLIDEIIDMGAVKGGNMYLVFGSEDPWYFDMIRMIMEELKVFFDWPVVMESDSITAKYIGFLENISKLVDLMKSFEVDADILSIKSFDPAGASNLDMLTDIQHDVLRDAYENGFFEDNRRMTITSLAKRRGISSSSYMKTLRRAQRNLIRELLEDH
ncbi:MAG: helix-turn-helix domain-containing protein [Candidatus Thermoplasmatota archaeon]|nr:helix-turn-helix domain-containing protein [Candidatus Thermoplasmatota archaeon]